MNFYELSEKLRAIEENATPGATGAGGIATVPNPIAREEAVEECGMEMMPHGQQDSVTMNISMNGSGSGGIKDLMDIIRNIETASQDDNVDIVLGKEDMLANPDNQGGAGASDESIEDESFGNSAHGSSGKHTYDIDAVTATGDDMHSKGDVKRLKVNGGENPLQEALVARLTAHYERIKEAQGPAMPDQPMDRIKQNVKPQADRPGLAPGGDPKLYDIQVWLNGRGYKIPTDGLNGPKTKEAYDRVVKLHSNALDIVHPSAVDIPQAIGQAIGTGVGWIETAWKNIKKGFRSGVDFDTPAPPSMEEGKNLDKIRDKYNKYD